MKRGLLFSAAILMVAANAMSQTDITPSRYVFADQPVGTYAIDEAYPGANPPTSYVNAVSNFHDGYVMILNTGNFGPGITSGKGKIVQDGTSIINLGSGVGNVLCIKGKNSTFPLGSVPADGFGVGWWNMVFYTSSLNVEKEQKIRFSVVFKVVENTINEAGKLLKFDAYTFSGNNFVNAAKKENPSFEQPEFGSSRFLLRDEDGDPIPGSDRKPQYDNDLWQQYEFDYQAGDAEGIPLRFHISFADQNPAFDNTAILIKSITMTKDPVGEPETKTLNLKWNTTGITNAVTDKEYSISYTCDQNNVTFHNLNIGQKIEVYSVNGQLVTSFTSNDSDYAVSLNDGFYIVKSDSAVTKIAVK